MSVIQAKQSDPVGSKRSKSKRVAHAHHYTGLFDAR